MCLIGKQGISRARNNQQTLHDAKGQIRQLHHKIF